MISGVPDCRDSEPNRGSRVSIRHIAIPAVLLLAAGAVPAAFVLSGPRSVAQQTRLPIYGVKVVKKYPHDRKAFCQGLVVNGETLIEGTGQLGESTLREVDLKSGRVKRLVRLSDKIFGEGVTVFKDKIFQLTWKAGLAYEYDRESMKYKKTHRYQGEGWGLTHDGKRLIMSDGTNTLRFLDPTTFKVVRKISVTRDGSIPVRDLNELEYINGEIFANIWHSDFIARIDPATGRVRSWLDLKPIRPAVVRNTEEAVLNGIAWDAEKKRLFVTGKDWPTLYEIAINRRPK